MAAKTEASTTKPLDSQKIISRVVVALVGDVGVGKSSIFNCITNQALEPTKQYRVNTIRFGKKTISFQGENHVVELLDTPGDKSSPHARDAHSLVAVYDITREESLDKVVKIVEDIRKKSGRPKDRVVVLVGNKLDQEKERRVTVQFGQETAEQFGGNFVECSALKDSNMDAILRMIMIEKRTKLGKKIIWWKK